MIEHVGTTGVYVSDQDKALDFYTNALGFETREDATIGDYRWVEVAPPGAETTIVLSKGEAEQVGKIAGIVFHTRDIQATHERLRGRGVTFTEAPTAQPWGLQAQFADQDGNTFVLVQR
jgi:predicted enzyme related to lactoylglutathione lyase